MTMPTTKIPSTNEIIGPQFLFNQLGPFSPLAANWEPCSFKPFSNSIDAKGCPVQISK